MKKLILFFAVFAAISFTSCGKSVKVEVSTPLPADSLVVSDTTVVDSVALDVDTTLVK